MLLDPHEPSEDSSPERLAFTPSTDDAHLKNLHSDAPQATQPTTALPE